MTLIHRRAFIMKSAAGAVGAGALSACGSDEAASATPQEGSVYAGPEITWRVASSYPENLDLLHGSLVRLAERVSLLTGGRFQMRTYQAGEIVPGLQVMDAVQAGTVQAGLTPGYYYRGKNPALVFDTAVPFGLTFRQQSAWLYYGGGWDLLRGIYADFGIVPFPAGNTGAQMGGWFREPVSSVADLNGLRMRIPGMGGEIMARLGTSVQVLVGGEIYPALERGAIDATEFVGAYDDEKLGFHRIAKNYYMPGWWEPSASTMFLVNRAAFDELPAVYQHILEGVCKEIHYDMQMRYDTENPKALERLVTQEGVQLRVFSQEILQAAWRETQAALEEEAAASASFRTVYDSWKAFRETTFPYFAGNEFEYARFAFPQIPGRMGRPTA
jgi:TRAP-type mannitol/chloroaromatic compound transport system substrate-binding protein